jgi:hypothetical protein
MPDPFGDEDIKMNLPTSGNVYDPVQEKFQVIGASHAVDRQSVYFRTRLEVGSPHGPKQYSTRFIKMKGVDRSSFALIQNSDVYSKDKSHVYYCNTIIDGADPDSFKILGGEELKKKLKPRFNFAQDKNHVYRELYILKDVKPEDFELLDQSHCLWKGERYEILNSAQTKLIPVTNK